MTHDHGDGKAAERAEPTGRVDTATIAEVTD